jgi:hypothetical protein
MKKKRFGYWNNNIQHLKKIQGRIFILNLPDLDEIPDGNINLIRFIRSDRMLDIFGEKFKT